MRCFISIDLPEHVKSEVFHRFENLYGRNFFKGKLTEKENLHLTLNFLGNIENEQIEEIKKELRQVKFGKFSCKIGKAGFFDNEDHVRIIWVELLSEGDKLNVLQKKISEILSEFKTDDKEFSSHITVARVKIVTDKKNLIKEMKNIHFKNLDFETDKFSLMKSELMRQGPEHRTLEEFKLK